MLKTYSTEKEFFLDELSDDELYQQMVIAQDNDLEYLNGMLSDYFIKFQIS